MHILQSHCSFNPIHSHTHAHKHTQTIPVSHWKTMIKPNTEEEYYREQEKTATQNEIKSLEMRIINAKNVNLNTYFDRAIEGRKIL